MAQRLYVGGIAAGRGYFVRKVFESMPRQTGTKPLLNFKADPTKELKGISVRQSLHDKLEAYALYVENSGDVKPNRSALMDRILEYFFVEDKGFQKFLKSPRAKPSAAPAGEA